MMRRAWGSGQMEEALWRFDGRIVARFLVTLNAQPVVPFFALRSKIAAALC
jgi:hypothetical protein